MSVSGGLHTAFERAQACGCQTMQIFTKNERQWKGKPLGEAELETWNAARAANAHVTPIITHDSYLINLASPVDEQWEKSLDAFKDEIQRNITLNIPYLVTHAGAHVGSGEDAGLDRIAQSVNRIHRELSDESGVAPATMILFETTAGQGTALGYKFEHWGRIFDKLEHPEWVGMCLDTCHVWAAGYDLATPEGWDASMSEFEHFIGTHRIKAFHVNDSQKERGSRVDRHEGIGMGTMGLEPFRFLMNDPRFKDTPKVLETPKGDDNTLDIQNMATLNSLIGTLQM